MAGERVFVGLGSNQAGPVEQLQHALVALAGLAGTSVTACSAFYANPPMGPPEQPDFVNAVSELSTSLEPLELLDGLQSIEHAQGRRRDGARWGPRTLDLDLLLYGMRTLDHPRLRLPHPGLLERAFVLHPLAEIAPGLVIPGHGCIQTLAGALPAIHLRRLDARIPPGREMDPGALR